MLSNLAITVIAAGQEPQTGLPNCKGIARLCTRREFLAVSIKTAPYCREYRVHGSTQPGKKESLK